MRSFLLTLALVAVALAGCTDDADNPGGTPIAQEGLPHTAGLYQSHPAYGFPTNALLPESDGTTFRHVAADGTVHWYRPVHKGLPGELGGLEQVAHVEGTSTGGGIAIFGPLAFIGQRTQGPLEVIDISDPTSPVKVGEAPDVPVRDADTILFPDGRLIVITTAGGSDQFAADVTDPTAPHLVGSITTEHGNHNIAVVPGTPITYNSGGSGTIDIVDWSDPENPVQIGTFQNGEGCHDITFFIDRDAEKYRAYCAGYPETQIWDIADPTAPEMLVRVPFPSVEQGLPVVGDGATDDLGVVFPLSFSHLAMVNHDASLLIVGDETGGGAINGCDYYSDAVPNQSGPLGNLWFYDLADEMAPQLVGHLSPSFLDALGAPGGVPDPDGLPFSALDFLASCTAHFGRVIEDTGFLVMGFYAAGVVLVDFTDPANPLLVDRLDNGGSVWDVWYYQGYLFTGDMSRGMDVGTFV
jgi:hypothetical protein